MTSFPTPPRLPNALRLALLSLHPTYIQCSPCSLCSPLIFMDFPSKKLRQKAKGSRTQGCEKCRFQDRLDRQRPWTLCRWPSWGWRPQQHPPLVMDNEGLNSQPWIYPKFPKLTTYQLLFKDKNITLALTFDLWIYHDISMFFVFMPLGSIPSSKLCCKWGAAQGTMSKVKWSQHWKITSFQLQKGESVRQNHPTYATSWVTWIS